jgi:ribonuclease-3
MESSSGEGTEWVDPLQAALGYRFQDADRLVQALTHRSYAHENPQKEPVDNERLEFLGDTVLNTIVSHVVMKRFSDRPEGDLTRIRSLIVNEKALAQMSRMLGLGRFLFLGQGENQTGGREKTSILANCYEAVVGAVYLDGGYEAAFTMVQSHFSEPLRAVEERLPGHDFKTRLQEETQKRQQTIPRYALLSESGPDHEKKFRVRVSIGREAMGLGEGRTKKEAEQKAAQEALERLLTRIK